MSQAQGLIRHILCVKQRVAISGLVAKDICRIRASTHHGVEGGREAQSVGTKRYVLREDKG